MKNDEKSISLSQGVFIQAGGMLSWIISPFTALYSLSPGLLIISIDIIALKKQLLKDLECLPQEKNNLSLQLVPSLSGIILTIALSVWGPRRLEQQVNNADYAIAYAIWIKNWLLLLYIHLLEKSFD